MEVKYALRAAAAAGDVEKARALIHGGADVNEPDPLSGMTPLGMAVTRRQLDMAKVLVQEFGASWHARTIRKQRTVLMLGAWHGATKCCAWLVAQGADPFEVTLNSRQTAIVLARMRGYNECARQMAVIHAELWSEGERALGRVPAVDILKDESGLLVREKAVRSRSLIKACRRGYKSTVLTILANLRNLDLNAKDQYGLTALQYAKHAGHKEIVAALKQAMKQNEERKRKQEPHEDLGGRRYATLHMRRDLLNPTHSKLYNPKALKERHPPTHTVFSAHEKSKSDAISRAARSKFKVRGTDSNDVLFDFSGFPGEVDSSAARRRERRDALLEAGYDEEELDALLEEVPGETRPLTVEERLKGGDPDGGRRYQVESWLETMEAGGYASRLRQLGVTSMQDLLKASPTRIQRDWDIISYRKLRSNKLTAKQKQQLVLVMKQEATDNAEKLRRLERARPIPRPPVSKDDVIADIVADTILDAPKGSWKKKKKKASRRPATAGPLRADGSFVWDPEEERLKREREREMGERHGWGKM